MSLQVQFPLSLTWIKYKHFLFFGLGGPIANTLVWFALRVQDQFANLQGEDSNETQPYAAVEQLRADLKGHVHNDTSRGDLKEHSHNDTSNFSNWDQRDKPLVCLFVEDKQMDVWVMQVASFKISHLDFFPGADADHLGIQHPFPHLGYIGETELP